MNIQLKQLFAHVPEVALSEMEDEDKELFSAMEEMKELEILEKSGSVALRIPKSLHEKLTVQAYKEGVSLNQYCLYKLAN